MTDTKKRLCYHPELIPTMWNQPKPEPAEVHACRCGRTWVCPTCGEGVGAIPHDCDKSDREFHESLERILKEHAATWQALADA